MYVCMYLHMYVYSQVVREQVQLIALGERDEERVYVIEILLFTYLNRSFLLKS